MVSLEICCTLVGHTDDRVWHAAWSPSGCYLASCGGDRVIRIWGNTKQLGSWTNSQDISCIATLEDAQARTLRSCEWSPDGKMMASASFDGTVVVWECHNNSMTSWEQIASLEGHDNEVKSVSWNFHGTLLATCGRDKRVWIWEKVTPTEFECISMLEGHTQDVKFVKFHKYQPILFSCSYDDTIKVWRESEDGDDWTCLQTLAGHSSTVWGLCTNHSGNKLVSTSDDRSMMLWECDDAAGAGSWMSSGRLANLHKFPIYSVDWSEVYDIIATGGGDNAISLVQCDRETVMSVIHQQADSHDSDVNCVRWNPSTDTDKAILLASAGDDGLVKIWRLVI